MKSLAVFLSALILLLSCSQENVAPQNLLEGWEGEYFTLTDELGNLFSPLTITEDGELLVAGVNLPYTFDEATNTLRLEEPTVAFTQMTLRLEEHSENKMFKGEVSTQSQQQRLAIRGSIIPQAVWSGEYLTQTSFWGSYFSPLIILEDGRATIAGEEVALNFDPETLQLSFDWTDIKTTKAKAAFVMDDDLPADDFSGSINPRPQDGPVSFSGTVFTVQ